MSACEVVKLSVVKCTDQCIASCLPILIDHTPTATANFVLGNLSNRRSYSEKLPDSSADGIASTEPALT